MRRVVFVLAAFCCALTAMPRSGVAQLVTGQLTSSDDMRQLAGAMVVLADSAGREQARTLTDAAGRFSLRASAPGRYRLRAELIGYASAASPLLTLDEYPLEYPFVIATQAIRLPSIQAISGARGCSRRADGAIVATLWNEIRKALEFTAWTSQFGEIDYDLSVYRLAVDPDERLMLHEERERVAATARLPFEVAGAAELASRGFSRMEDEALVLLGPDASVLVSDEFLDGHCFRLALHPVDSQLIGLEFEPVRSRSGVADIEGVLWVDHAAAELRRIDYSYTSLPSPFANHPASGRIEFHELPNGLWIVDAWRIRAPVLVTERNRLGARRVSARGFTEDGGVVVRARALGDTWYGPTGDATIEGVVRDAPGGEPLPGARVFVAGMPHDAVSDEYGRYRIAGVPAGRYGLSFSYELNGDLAVPVPLDSVTVAAGTATRRDLELPAFTDMLRRLCPDATASTREYGLIYGIVTDGAGAPQPGVTLSASWRRRGLWGSAVRRAIRSGPTGHYHICWAPIDDDIAVRVFVDGREVTQRDVRIPESRLPLTRMDLETGG